MRDLDWAATPLGPPAGWPSSLRSAIALCLDAAMPMAIYWGPAFCLLYNDASIPILGARHPAGLGLPAQRVWPEAWSVLEPEIRGVMAGGSGVHGERARHWRERNGVQEDTWWTYSLTAIRNEAGEVEGVLNVAIETTDVTAAERSRRQSEAYLRVVLDSAVNGLYSVDRDGHTILCNAVFLNMLGFASEQEVLGRKLHDVIHHTRPDGSAYPVEECPIYNTARTGIAAHVEQELFYRTDGSSVPVEYWVRPILRDGEVKGAVCTFIDITERLNAAGALRESENRFRQIADAAPVPMWVTRLDRKRAFVNRAYVDFLGITYQEAIDFDWRHVIHPDDVKRIYVEQVEKESLLRPFTLEARYRNQHGEYRWLRSESQPRWDPGGEHTGFIGVAYDVTEARRSAIGLEALNVTLEARVEARTRERDRAWKYSQDLQAVLTGTGTLLAANQAWRSILGWEPEEIIGHHLGDFTAEDAQRPRSPPSSFASGLEWLPSETLLRHKDDGTRWIGWVAAPAQGLVYASGRNITAEKAAAMALEAAQEQLRQSQKMEAVGQLTGGIAHDFNNLLTGITGSLEILQHRLVQGRHADAGRYVDAARSAALRAAALTHRLLAFSRRQTLDPKILDVNALVAGMTELIGRTTGAAIQTEFSAAAGLWSALADPNQLENALLNLCINARDAMPDGGRLKIVTANAELASAAAAALALPAGDYVAVSVTDTGTGMASETVKRAFDPFFTTKPIGQGTGLGLSMIYGFARQSGGGVRIDSALGSGTTMWLFLPRHRRQGGPVPPVMQGTNRVPAVLVVDDNATDRARAAEHLQTLGYAVLRVEDPRKASAIVQSAAVIDLLLTDIDSSTAISARELAALARRTRPTLPVLIVTGHADDVAAASDAATMLLLKPFTFDGLALQVSTMIPAQENSWAVSAPPGSSVLPSGEWQ